MNNKMWSSCNRSKTTELINMP